MMTFQEALSQGRTETFSVYKTDDDKRLVFGWASIAVTAEGEQLEDRQHDIIDPEDLEEAAYEYVLNFRDTGEEHMESLRKKGRLVESCVFTEDKQEAMGLPAGILPVGWWIGFKIDDDGAWEKVKNGTYRMFSIEGTAERVPVEKAALEEGGCAAPGATSRRVRRRRRPHAGRLRRSSASSAGIWSLWASRMADGTEPPPCISARTTTASPGPTRRR